MKTDKSGVDLTTVDRKDFLPLFAASRAYRAYKKKEQVLGDLFFLFICAGKAIWLLSQRGDLRNQREMSVD